jgi:UDPglucose--hexose-1-phosphate uridylyltransferase
MSISFKKINDKMRFLNPLKDFSMDEIPFEIRYDPLTGQTTRVFNLPYKPIERPDFKDHIEKSRGAMCPFCPESIDKSTPLYPKEIVPDGRVRVGEACLVPNLLPLDRYTGVCVITQAHFIAIEDFTFEIIKDAFTAALIFIKKVAEHDPAARFFNINWNYMPPAGSSIVHPHLQVNCGEIPTRQQRIQIEASQRYYLKNGQTFWEDYINAERKLAERHLTDMGSVFWTMSFAPHGALPDLWCIFSDCDSLLRLKNNELDHFLRGLATAIRYIHEEGLYSFNVSIFSGRENDHFRVNARVTPRLLLREIGNSDQTYYQVLHREPTTMKPPESMREKVQTLFER